MANIRISDETKERLSEHGVFGEGWDELLNKLADVVDSIAEDEDEEEEPEGSSEEPEDEDEDEEDEKPTETTD
jgi:hypothetical protein